MTQETKTMPKIALGAWGNDGTFGGNLTSEKLRPIFDAAMNAGMNLWDTALVYDMSNTFCGISERYILEGKMKIIFTMNILKSSIIQKSWI